MTCVVKQTARKKPSRLLFIPVVKHQALYIIVLLCLNVTSYSEGLFTPATHKQ